MCIKNFDIVKTINVIKQNRIWDRKGKGDMASVLSLKCYTNESPPSFKHTHVSQNKVMKTIFLFKPQPIKIIVFKLFETAS